MVFELSGWLDGGAERNLAKWLPVVISWSRSDDWANSGCALFCFPAAVAAIADGD